MEVIKNQIDELNVTLTINVTKSDIAEDVEKTLREYRRKANINGFRPGNAPMGLVKKMYGSAVIADELNKTVGKSLSDYIENEKLNILGEPMPNENQKPMDIANDENFEFIFDLGLAPEFEVKLSKRDKVNNYIIKADEEAIKKYIDGYQQRFGKFEEATKSTIDSVLEGELIEIAENGDAIENGINSENTSISVKVIKDEEIQKSFIGVGTDTIIDFDIKKAFPNNSEIASMLKIKKEDVEKISNNFRFTAKTVKEYKQAEINQELFDKCFGEGTINSEEEFRNRVAEDIKASFSRECKYKLMLDLKEKLIKKLDLHLPENFLKRWLTAINENLKPEDIDNEFSMFLDDLRWTLIKNKVAKENEIKVSHEDLVAAAKSQIVAQFAQYGMAYIPDEYVVKYANEILGKEEEARKIYEHELEDKVVENLAELVKLEDTEISTEEFSNLFKK